MVRIASPAVGLPGNAKGFVGPWYEHSSIVPNHQVSESLAEGPFDSVPYGHGMVLILGTVCVVSALIAGTTYIVLVVPERKLHRSLEMVRFEAEYIAGTRQPPPHWLDTSPESSRRKAIRRLSRLIDLCRSHAVKDSLPWDRVEELEEILRDWRSRQWDAAPVD